MNLSVVQSAILKMLRSLGIDVSFKVRGDDALMFCLHGQNILVRYYPEIESYQVQRRNSLTNVVENNVSVSSDKIRDLLYLA
jgi:hypothetical protein